MHKLNYINQFNCPGTFAPIADYTLLSKAVEAAHEHGVDIKVGNIVSNDTFYAAEGTNNADGWRRMGRSPSRWRPPGSTPTPPTPKRALCIPSPTISTAPRPLLRAAPGLLHPDDGVAALTPPSRWRSSKKKFLKAVVNNYLAILSL